MRLTLLSGLPRATVTKISILVLLSTIDYMLTCFAVNTGIAREANPILSGLSLEGIGIVKTVGILALIYLEWNKPRILNVAIILMALVVIWNVFIMVF